ncbi:hypothetical protein PV08_04249 [Exophiala spinifera]|uniref:Clr5 domain-containing protein n=1 Tax=Exophiala spinifera TaxID=91928 RepID=A0A0D2BDP4_9EURO|nr:uncharacterized protein PV08_04249 [Exophiala spinifera]KIW17058.1 hypothetical protein PV08_04249 [Exophiala spinifera]
MPATGYAVSSNAVLVTRALPCCVHLPPEAAKINSISAALGSFSLLDTALQNHKAQYPLLSPRPSSGVQQLSLKFALIFINHALAKFILLQEMVGQRKTSDRADVFIHQDPNVPRYNQRLSRQQWADLKPLIFALHQQGTTQNGILEALQERSISVTKAQLYHQLMNWGLRTYKKNAADIQNILAIGSSSTRPEVESPSAVESLENGELELSDAGRDRLFQASDDDMSSPTLRASERTNTSTSARKKDMFPLGDDLANKESIDHFPTPGYGERLKFHLPPYEMDSDVVAILSSYDKKQDHFSDRLEKINRAAAMLFVLRRHKSSFDFFYHLLSILNDDERQSSFTRVSLAQSVINCRRSAQSKAQCDLADSAILQLQLWSQYNTLFCTADFVKEFYYRECVDHLCENLTESETCTANSMLLLNSIYMPGVEPWSKHFPQDILRHCFECARLKKTLSEALHVIQDFVTAKQTTVDDALRGFCDRRPVDWTSLQLLCLQILMEVRLGGPPPSQRAKCCCSREINSFIFYHVAYAVPAVLESLLRPPFTSEWRNPSGFLAIIEQLRRECISTTPGRYQLLVRSYIRHWSKVESYPLLDRELSLSMVKSVAVFAGLLTFEDVDSMEVSTVPWKEGGSPGRHTLEDVHRLLNPRPMGLDLSKMAPTIAPSCTSSLSSGYRRFKISSKRFEDSQSESIRSRHSQSSGGFVSSRMSWEL